MGKAILPDWVGVMAILPEEVGVMNILVFVGRVD
jgi:hypothetical protein